jgi:hypothetical protein
MRDGLRHPPRVPELWTLGDFAFMKIIGLALILVSFLSRAHAQSEKSPNAYAELHNQTWLTNYYGKTLSSLGQIVSIKIDRRSSGTSDYGTNWTHADLWRQIEQSKIQDYSSMSVIGVGPLFTIEYADGLRVRVGRHAAIIVLPDGREGPVIMKNESPPMRVHRSSIK